MRPVYRILASRTELYLVEAFVKAADAQEAETRFYEVLEGEGSAVNWTQDFDSSDTHIHSIEQVPTDHDPVPSGSERPMCLICGRSVSWTGVSAKDSPTGTLIPGPWIHNE